MVKSKKKDIWEFYLYFFIVFLIWQSIYNRNRYKRLKHEYDRLNFISNKLGEDYAKLEKEYSALEQKYDYLKMIHLKMLSIHVILMIIIDEYDRQLWTKSRIMN